MAQAEVTSTTAPPTILATTTASPTTTEPPTTSATEPVDVEIDYEVTDDAIGPVKVGSTLEELIEALGPGFDITFEESIRVDVNGYRVARNRETVFYAIEFEPGGTLDYREEVGGHNQTVDYRPEAKIGRLWLRCFVDGPYACGG